MIFQKLDGLISTDNLIIQRYEQTFLQQYNQMSLHKLDDLMMQWINVTMTRRQRKLQYR